MATTPLFNTNLTAFQGVLISADNVQSFATLTAKGGNEKKIAIVINNLRNFLKKENYINDEGVTDDAIDNMRHFALFIVLNSEITILNKLVSANSSIDHLIWTIPSIPQYLLSEMMWKLCMEKFVYEIITFSYPQLALEVANALIINIKYFNPTECLKELHLLSTACFRMLCRINFFNYEENLLTSGYNIFEMCMMYFCNPPNESKLEQLSKDGLYKYYGNCLHTILTILQECLNQYNTTQTYNLQKSLGIYEMTYINDSSKKTDYKPCEISNKSLLEILNKSIIDILDKSQKLVMGINLDIFCAWSEFEESGTTMQETIGELCYKVRQQLLDSHVSDHPMVDMMEQISRKPVNVQEIINTTDSLEIIEHIKRNNNDSIQWLQAIVHRDKLCEDKSLLEILDAKLNQLHKDDCYKLFQRLYNDQKNCTSNQELVKSLTVKTYQLCHRAVKDDILEDHFKDKYFNNLLETTQFTTMLTEIFNKLAVSPDSDLSDVLSVFIQNPGQVYDKIFKSAIENIQQLILIFKVVKFLERFSNHYYNEDTEPCFTIILKRNIDELHTSVKQNNMIIFVSKLKKANIISGTKLLLTIIMPKLHNALVNKNNAHINLQCNLINKSYSVTNLLEYRAPMLAMLGQVLTQVRWKINTFDEISPMTLKIALDLQTSLMRTYNDNIPEKEVAWLKSKLKDLDPLNMYYYRAVWNPPGNTFVEVISGIHIHKNIDIELLPMWLAQVLCSSALHEWNYIWKSLKIFDKLVILDLYHNALLSVLKAEKCNRTKTTWACMQYCFRNFMHCIRYNYFKEPLSNRQVLSVTNKLESIISNVEDEYIEDLGKVVLPLFAYIVQRRQDYDVDISRKLESILSGSKLNTCIGNLFSNGSN